MEGVQKRGMMVYRGTIVYNILRKIFERKLKLNNYTKGPMRPSPSLGVDHEKITKQPYKSHAVKRLSIDY